MLNLRKDTKSIFNLKNLVGSLLNLWFNVLKIMNLFMFVNSVSFKHCSRKEEPKIKSFYNKENSDINPWIWMSLNNIKENMSRENNNGKITESSNVSNNGIKFKKIMLC